ncbi:MAG: ABC transporter permease, partial [Actinomycetota bacterium]
MERRQRLRLGPIALTLPAVVGIALLFVAPFATFVVYSFLTAGDLPFQADLPLTLEAYDKLVDSEVNRTLARNSAWTGFLAAAVTVAVAMPVAYWLRYAAGSRRNLVLFLITATMFASYLVRIYAWRSMLGQNGVINSALISLGVLDEPIGFILFSRFAVTVALIHIFLPYVVLLLYAALLPVKPDLLETAQDLGAGIVRRWTKTKAVPAGAATSGSTT